MNPQFEATGNFDDWPPNEHGKPTQAAVFGVFHPDKGKVFELLWSGSFPDLEPALYWAAKKEMEAVRKGKWMMASRVAWQHGLTPEEALAAVRKQMEPQIDHALRSYAESGDVDLGSGPMRTIGPDEPVPRYVEITPTRDDEADPLASFVLPAPGSGPPSLPHIPRDPRRP